MESVIVIVSIFLLFVLFYGVHQSMSWKQKYDELKEEFDSFKEGVKYREKKLVDKIVDLEPDISEEETNRLMDNVKKECDSLIEDAEQRKEDIINKAILDAKCERDKLFEDCKRERDKIIHEAELEKEEVFREAKRERQQIIDVAKCRAKQIVEEAADKIQKAEECIKKCEEREKNFEIRFHALEEREKQIKWHHTRADNIRKEALAIKKEAEEIREDMYKQSDEYMAKLQERMQEMITQVHISNDFDFECASAELKEKLKKHEFWMKERREVFASIDYHERHHEENMLKILALCFCDVLIDSLIGNVGKIGIDKAYKRMRSAIASVEGLMPKTLNFTMSPQYIIAKKEQLALIAEIERYKAQKREERKLKLQAEREEKQAQRELEAERKRAEKDAMAAEVAIEKSRIALAQAKTKEQIDKYEEQIKALQEALRMANERRERALSMAQQTRCGYVYIISNVGSFGEGVYKIGMTRRVEPMDRVVELGDASVPFPFDVHAMIYTEDAPGLESALHRAFDERKVNAVNCRKEYFRASLDEIKQEVAKQGIEYTEWIDEPMASQWRDSNRRML